MGNAAGGVVVPVAGLVIVAVGGGRPDAQAQFNNVQVKHQDRILPI